MGWRSTLTFALVAGGVFAASHARGDVALFKQCAGASLVQIFQGVSAPDGSMITTREGETIRLAGIVAPGELDRNVEVSDRSTKVLHDLVAGKKISVSAKSRAKDRYGRIVGQVVLLDDLRWIQMEMVTAGAARVAPQIEGGACNAALLGIEQKARQAGVGIWSDPRFAVYASQDLSELTASEGRFMLVEGVVRRVGESGGRVYLDFGGRFNEDFSVIIPRDANKAFTSAGINLRDLRGARLRVRGIVSMRGGPVIEVHDPSAMELVKGGV